jgi:3-dehydroquinate synthase
MIRSMTTTRASRRAAHPPDRAIGGYRDPAPGRRVAGMTAPTTPGLHVRDALPLAGATGAVTATARREDRYTVHVTREWSETVRRLDALLDGVRTVALITDDTVEALYGAQLTRALRARDLAVTAHALPAGEASKSLDSAVALWHWLAASELGRRDVLLAFGGGVVCDVAGWVAAAYMRGVPYVNLPTTLLAMVDGALGGKVAVNHPVAKNLLGAFHQPAGVVSDVRYLRSLERRHVAAGIAECVKKGVIASPDYFAFIEDHADALLAGDAVALERLVRSAAAIKTALVERDPYEEDLRRPLNFGHTIGHPLETVTGYAPLLHGEAVAFGMAAEARISAARGWLPEPVLERLLDLLARCGLPTDGARLPRGVHASELVAATEKVRLIRAGSLRWVLPVGLGETVIVDDVTDAELVAALAACGVT